jgi:chromate transporter
LDGTPAKDAPPPSIALRTIFVTFVRIGLVSVGGGGSAHIHRAVVERLGWLDEARFVEAATITRTLPGTNVSNLAAFIGGALRGPAGAFAAAVGVVLPGVLAVVGAAAAYARVAALHSAVGQGLLRGLTAGALGVMVVLVVQSARAGLHGVRAAAFAIAAFAAVAILYANMAFVIALLVPLAALVIGEEKK